MAKTNVELFRIGRNSGAQMDKVKSSDLTIYQKSGVDWVKAGTGGVSTLEAPDPGLNGIWWRLPAGTPYPDNVLIVVNDIPAVGHWSWEPAYDMLLDDFLTVLRGFNALFTRV